MTTEPSGRLYSAVTKHWPRIAAGLVVVIGIVEFVVGGLTADSGIEFYLMVWAGTTGGLWFLFDRVFGERHFTAACFLRSAIATTVTVVLAWIIFGGALATTALAGGTTYRSAFLYYGPLAGFSTVGRSQRI